MKNRLSSVIGFLKPDAGQLVFVVAGIVIVGAFALSRFSNETLDARVEFTENSPIAEFKKSRTQLTSESIRLGETDSNLRLAERIREGSSIAIGLSWFVLSERVSDAPKTTSDIGELMENFSRSPLLPPGCHVLFPVSKPDYGLIETPRGLYFIRYRANPVAIEVLATGNKGSADGAVFVFRVPDRMASEYLANQPNQTSGVKESAGGWASLYIAPENKNAYIPAPFAPGDAYLNTGWKPEPMRIDKFTPEKLAELQNFLESPAKGK